MSPLWEALHESWLYAAVFWLVSSLAFLLVIRRTNRVEQNVLAAVYFLKSLAVAGYAVYAVEVFGGGDSLLFWETALHLRELIASAPELGWKVFFLEFNRAAPEVVAHFQKIEAERFFAYIRDARAFQVARLACAFSFIAGKNFLAVSYMFGLIGLGGMVLIFKGLRSLSGNASFRLTALAALGLPCVIFWSSGVHKDALVLFALGLVFWATASSEKSAIWRATWVAPAFFMLWALKPFVLFWLAPCWALWVGCLAIGRTNWSKKSRAVARVSVFVVIAGAGLLALTFSPFDWSYLWLEIYETRTLALTGQALTEGALRTAPAAPTAAETLPLLPLGFVSALYRPFLWEAHNAQAMLAAFENLGLLALTVFLLVRADWKNLAELFAKRPALWFLLPFGVGMAAFLGVSTAFFGTLVRYKIYAAPFFFAGLLLLQKEKKQS